MWKRLAYWTYDDNAARHLGHLYYFAPLSRAKGPYLTQRHVKAIIDIADDGTLAGVELVEGMPEPPEMEGDPSITMPRELTDEQADAAMHATAVHLDIKGSQLTVNREKMKARYWSLVRFIEDSK